MYKKKKVPRVSLEELLMRLLGNSLVTLIIRPAGTFFAAFREQVGQNQLPFFSTRIEREREVRIQAFLRLLME
jgi:hypothetical protein